MRSLTEEQKQRKREANKRYREKHPDRVKAATEKFKAAHPGYDKARMVKRDPAHRRAIQRKSDKKRRAENAANGICTECGAPPEVGKKKCAECAARVSAASKRSNIKVRDEVLLHYGNKCACCNEPNKEFLQIDHIDNNGAEHRRSDASAWRIYRWLKKNDYPEGFQILCANCNWAKGRYGYCPHQRVEKCQSQNGLTITKQHLSIGSKSVALISVRLS